MLLQPTCLKARIHYTKFIVKKGMLFLLRRLQYSYNVSGLSSHIPQILVTCHSLCFGTTFMDQFDVACCCGNRIKARIHYTKFYRKDNISPKSTKHLLNDGEFVTRCRCLIHAAPDPKTFQLPKLFELYLYNITLFLILFPQRLLAQTQTSNIKLGHECCSKK